MSTLSSMLVSMLLASDGGIVDPYIDDYEPVEEGPADAPFENPDSGVYEVESARRFDGGTLPSGWWISRPRMELVGEHISKCEYDLWVEKQTVDALAERIQPAPVNFGFVPGLVLGVTAGAVVGATTVFLLKR